MVQVITRGRFLKRVLLLLLIGALVATGVLVGLPGEAAAAAKATTYNVLILNQATPWDRLNPTVNNESPAVALASVNNAAPEPGIDTSEGRTFQMVVDTKPKTEKLKTGPATYYPVTIPGKSYKVPIARYDTSMGTVQITTKMKGNAKGKLYISGGDVDVSQVMAEKKLTTKIGDGTVDPAGSLIITITTESTTVIVATGKKFLKVKTTTIWTTGKSSTLVDGSKSGLEDKAMPGHDPTGLLAKPLKGEPLNLAAGTGELVNTQASMNLKSPLGEIDFLRGEIWVMKITPASSGGKNPGYSWMAGAVGGSSTSGGAASGGSAGGAAVGGEVLSTQPVDIDIKPGSYPNPINPNRKGVIPVAILTTSAFDASTVDPGTVRFGPNEAIVVQWALEDVNNDGNIDLILHFKVQDIGLSASDTKGTLTGQTVEGRNIVGEDSVYIVPTE